MSPSEPPEPERRLELADIFRLHGPAYLEKYGERMPPSHRRAIADIIDCRTSALGGEVYFCDDCAEYRYSYHSCKNRSCNKCGHEQAQAWLDAQKLARDPEYVGGELGMAGVLQTLRA
jgi:ribosomal protein L37AE/L43A